MVLTHWDLLLTPFYLIIIFFISSYIQNKYEPKNPAYKYYVSGLFAKIAGAISLCLIYQFYYEGGDTTNYFDTAVAIINLLEKNPAVFFSVMAGNSSPENYSFFNAVTQYPVYWNDKNAFFVSRFIVPLVFLSFKTFTLSAILLAWVCYSGVWRLYLLFCSQFPLLKKEFAISILYIPSVVFWGSGLLKDTITLAAVGWYTYSFYHFFIAKRYNLYNAVYLFISAYLLIAIKPYILFALLPGSLIWLSNVQISKIHSKFLKALATPFLLLTGIGLSFLALNQLGDFLGLYKLDTVLDRAVIVQNDLKQDYYGGNSFDIGEFDASISSMIGKAPLAISAALFRPYLWDARNPVMLLSALENTYILLLTLFLLFKLKFLSFFTLIGKNPLLLFSVLFSVFFAFSVGISISNFGSLVRLKIPAIPFFVSSLFVLKYFYDQTRKSRI